VLNTRSRKQINGFDFIVVESLGRWRCLRIGEKGGGGELENIPAAVGSSPSMPLLVFWPLPRVNPMHMRRGVVMRMVYPREKPPHTRTARAQPPAAHRRRHSRPHHPRHGEHIPTARQPHSNGLCSPPKESPGPGSALRHVDAGPKSFEARLTDIYMYIDIDIDVYRYIYI